MISPELIHYLAAALSIALSSIGGGIGQGYAGGSVAIAGTRQESAQNSLNRILILGMALIESGLIIALVVSLVVLFSASDNITWNQALGELAMSIAIGISAAISSIASGYIVHAAAVAVSRQPFFGQKILTVMLISQSILEAAVIFSFVIVLLIYQQIYLGYGAWYDGMKYLGAGIAMGLGSIGPSIGQSIFAVQALTAISNNKTAYGKLFPFTLLNQAVIETPLIFCLLISIISLYTPIEAYNWPYLGINIIVAGITIGFSSFGTSIGIGNTASKAITQIGLHPERYASIMRTTLFAEAFIESSVIYGMIVALFLIVYAV